MKTRHVVGIITGLMAALLVLLAPYSLEAANIDWNNAGTDFNSGASWTGGNAPGTADRAVFSAAAVTQPNLSGALTIQGLSFNVSGYTLTSGGSALTLTTTGAGGSEATSSIISLAGFSNTINAPIILGGAGGTQHSFRGMDGSQTTFNGVISSTNAITGLNLTGGSGTFTFNAANTYSGTTTLGLNGTIVIGHAQALSSGTLVLNNNNGGLQAGIGLTGVNKLTNNILFQSSEVFLYNSGSNAIQFGGTVDLNAGTGSAKLIKSQISGGAIFDGVISNDNGRGLAFQLTNNSNVTLNGVNTYTGDTGIRGTGSVTVSSIGNAGVAGNLGQGSAINLGLSSSGGILIYTGTGENTSKVVNLNGGAGGNATIEHAGTGLLNFTANTTATVTGAKTLTLSGSTTGIGQISGAIVNSSSGATSVAKSGTGTWILSGTNTYTGTTTLNGGVLQAAEGVGLNSSSILQLRGGVLQTNGTFTRTLGSAAGNVNWTAGSGGFAARGGNLILNLNNGTGAVTWGAASTNIGGTELIFGSSTADSRVDLQNAVALSTSARSIRVNDNTSSGSDIARISGVISGGTGGGIIKEGAGVLELTGTNTYTGATTVNAGTLLINANMASATGNVTVATGATLGGTGTIGGATTVNGTLSAGNSPGTLTFSSSLTLASTSTSLFEIDSLALFDSVLVGSSLVYGGTLSLDFGYLPVLGSQFDLFNFTGQSGTFSSVNFLDAGYGGTFDHSTGILTVTAVPEPSTYMMLAAGLGALLWLRRRKAV